MCGTLIPNRAMLMIVSAEAPSHNTNASLNAVTLVAKSVHTTFCSRLALAQTMNFENQISAKSMNAAARTALIASALLCTSPDNQA